MRFRARDVFFASERGGQEVGGAVLLVCLGSSCPDDPWRRMTWHAKLPLRRHRLRRVFHTRIALKKVDEDQGCLDKRWTWIAVYVPGLKCLSKSCLLSLKKIRRESRVLFCFVVLPPRPFVMYILCEIFQKKSMLPKILMVGYRSHPNVFNLYFELNIEGFFLARHTRFFNPLFSPTIPFLLFENTFSIV